MAAPTRHRTLAICLLVGVCLGTTIAALGQKVTVDATPSHVANTFSPVRSLGAAIDRLRTGTPDKLLTDPLLKEILARDGRPSPIARTPN